MAADPGAGTGGPDDDFVDRVDMEDRGWGGIDAAASVFNFLLFADVFGVARWLEIAVGDASGAAAGSEPGGIIRPKETSSGS
jgi:hypothetical protein